MAYFRLEHGWHDFIYNVFLHNLGLHRGFVSRLTAWPILEDAAAHLWRSQAIIWFFFHRWRRAVVVETAIELVFSFSRSG